MKVKFKIDINAFESISTVSEQKLVGGFSGSFSANSDAQTLEQDQSNNCLGGNCADGCGVNGPFPNIGCNSYSGCGLPK